MTVAWSYSRLNKYRQCPLKSYWMDYAPKQAKVVEPPNPIFEKGKEWHTYMENAIKRGDQLPEFLQQTKPLVDAIRSFPEVYVEQQLAFTEDLKETSWFGKDVWCRVIWDVAALNHDRSAMIVGDHKTGKPRPDSDQLELFAASAFRRFPSVQEVRTQYYFLEHKKYSSQVFHRKSEDHIWQKFGEEASLIATSKETGDWPARPGKHCDWCHVPKSKCAYSQVED